MNRLAMCLRPGRRRIMMVLLAGLVITVLALPLITGPKPAREIPLVERMVCPRNRSSALVEPVLRNLSLRPDMRVLDIGNADPRLSLPMAEAVAMMNKCLLIPLFIGHPYFEGHKIRREAIASDKQVIRKMAEACLALHRCHELASYFHILEFVRVENGEKHRKGIDGHCSNVEASLVQTVQKSIP